MQKKSTYETSACAKEARGTRVGERKRGETGLDPNRGSESELQRGNIPRSGRLNCLLLTPLCRADQAFLSISSWDTSKSTPWPWGFCRDTIIPSSGRRPESTLCPLTAISNTDSGFVCLIQSSRPGGLIHKQSRDCRDYR